MINNLCFQKKLLSPFKFSFKFVCKIGVDELKQVKVNVKMSIFLQFLLHLFMWCHFNGM